VKTVEKNRYRVRPAGDSDPDHEFDIEAATALHAAKRLAYELGNDHGHGHQSIQVWVAGKWVTYWCEYKLIPDYDVSRMK
jgi:hypothetical protein